MFGWITRRSVPLGQTFEVVWSASPNNATTSTSPIVSQTAHASIEAEQALGDGAVCLAGSLRRSVPPGQTFEVVWSASLNNATTPTSPIVSQTAHASEPALDDGAVCLLARYVGQSRRD